jgi:cysteine synthase
MIVESILDAVGCTPLVRLGRLSSGNVFAKAEFLNPGGYRDRVAKHHQSALQEGRLKPGMTIIEATSGNTGI